MLYDLAIPHSACVDSSEILIDEVKVRPGHPMLLAEIGTNKFLVGLPGNPLAAVVAFISLALPVIRKMQGRILENLEKVYHHT